MRDESLFGTVSAAVNLLSLYHDSILARRLKQSPSKIKPIIPPSVHARYTRAWADKDTKYKWAARLLEIIKFIELLVEMGLRRKVGKKGTLRGILLLESIK
jgi:peroxin-16